MVIFSVRSFSLGRARLTPRPAGARSFFAFMQIIAIGEKTLDIRQLPLSSRINAFKTLIIRHCFAALQKYLSTSLGNYHHHVRNCLFL